MISLWKVTGPIYMHIFTLNYKKNKEWNATHYAGETGFPALNLRTQ